MEIFVVPANYLYAASLHQAINDVRYYLNGIAIFPYSRHVVATDGHTMATCLLDDERFLWNNCDRECPGKVREPHWIIASGDLGKALSLKKPTKKEKWAVISFNSGTGNGQVQYCTYESADTALSAAKAGQVPATWMCSCRLIDGVFPQYERIKPDYSSPIKSAMLGVNAEYMIRIANSAKAVASDKQPYIAIHYPIVYGTPVEVEIDGISDLQIIFMQGKGRCGFTEKATTSAAA